MVESGRTVEVLEEDAERKKLSTPEDRGNRAVDVSRRSRGTEVPIWGVKEDLKATRNDIESKSNGPPTTQFTNVLLEEEDRQGIPSGNSKSDKSGSAFGAEHRSTSGTHNSSGRLIHPRTATEREGDTGSGEYTLGNNWRGILEEIEWGLRKLRIESKQQVQELSTLWNVDKIMRKIQKCQE
jgi:hypothetical protein